MGAAIGEPSGRDGQRDASEVAATATTATPEVSGDQASAGGLIDIDVHPFAGSREFSAPGGSTRSLRCLTSTGEYKSEAI